jgi:plasmid stabilization system protein ParE
MYTIIISSEARADLTNHYDTIAEKNSTAALKIFDAARQTFADLARFPRSGSLSPYHPDPTQESILSFTESLQSQSKLSESFMALRISIAYLIQSWIKTYEHSLPKIRSSHTHSRNTVVILGL